jgi:hypothetical protein
MTQTPETRIHRMELSEILETTFKLYRENLALFAMIVAAPAILLGLLQTLHLHGFAALPYSLVTIAVEFVAFGALIQAISARYFGRPMVAPEAYGAVGAGKLGMLAVAAILDVLAIAIGLILLIVPGIYLAIRFLFFAQAIVLEGTGLTEAFGRSGELVKGSWWRVFGITLLVGIPCGIVAGIIGAVCGAVAGPVLGVVIGTVLAAMLIWPIEITAMTLLYSDLRARHEGPAVQIAA